MTTVSTSGIWTGVSQPVVQLQGLNTEHLSWGVPANPQQTSGYVFQGVSAAPVPLDGTEFKIGTFTHTNFPLEEIGSTQFQVFLKLRLRFDETGPSQEFTFAFDHNETPNDGPHPDDQVTLPNVQSQETVVLEGKNYALHLTGFQQGGKLVTEFNSPEGRSNSADIFARLVAVPVPQPLPQPQPPYPHYGKIVEDPCPIKNVADTGSLFALALERLNRRSVVYLLEQVIAAVNAQCAMLADRPTGGGVSPVDVDKLRNEFLIAIDELRQSSNACANEANNIKAQIGSLVASLPQRIEQTIKGIDIEHVMHQIEGLNSRLVIIQKAAQELDDGELNQVRELLGKMLVDIDFGSVVRNISIDFGGRSIDLWRLLEVLATADRVASIQIRYGDPDPWEIAGAYFVLTDSTPVSFRARVLPDPSGLRIVYLFETDDWKGLPARFSFVYLVRKASYAICGNRFNVDTFDGVEQTNVVFDLCSQLDRPASFVSLPRK